MVKMEFDRLGVAFQMWADSEVWKNPNPSTQEISVMQYQKNCYEDMMHFHEQFSKYAPNGLNIGPLNISAAKEWLPYNIVRLFEYAAQHTKSDTVLTYSVHSRMRGAVPRLVFGLMNQKDAIVRLTLDIAPTETTFGVYVKDELLERDSDITKLKYEIEHYHGVIDQVNGRYVFNYVQEATIASLDSGRATPIG